MDESALALLAVASVLLVWLLPILVIAGSRKTTGREKVAWILAFLLMSWLAFVFYLLLAPIRKEE